MIKAILLSGGMDSIALSYLTKPAIAFTIDYGQKPAQKEISVSKIICKYLDIEHVVISVDCSHLGSGDLSRNRPLALSPSSEWWPYRNQLLVTLASMKAITMNVNELLVGSVRNDNFHQDGKSEFYNKLSDLTQFQEGHLKIVAPAIHLSTSELITASKIPMDILMWAHSCHTSNTACGTCPGCLKHLRVRQDLGKD
jgi:7-cyano-7-deazaguanine synthase